MGRFRARTPLPPGFGTIWLAVAIDLIGFGIVLPILPIYARRFHTTAFQATLLVAAFSAASLVCSPLWGRISDRFGRRPVLLVSLAGTAVGSLLTGLAGGLAVLLIGRIIDGASGASVSVAQAAASDLATPAARPRLFGLLGAAFGVGFVAGPALGALAALWGPRLPFFLAAGLATINTFVALRRLPETRPPGLQPRPRRPGSLAALAGGRGVVPLLGVAFCALAAFGGFEATFALFGQTHLGLGIASAAAVFSIVGLVLVVVQAGLVQPVVARFGEKRTLVGGLLANAAGLVVLADARSWARAAPALLLLTVGQGLVQTTMATLVVRRSDPGARGQALGAQQSAGGLGRVVGPAAAGALLGAGASATPYLFGAALMLVAVALVLGPVGRSPDRQDARSDVTLE
jgi:predicted MFS family arabinose efflux permease